MEVNNRDIRGILKFFFVQGKTAAQSRREIDEVLGDKTVSKNTVEEWFRRFRAKNFDTDDHYLGGRPSVTNVDAILEIIAEDRHISIKSISEQLKIPTSTVHRHLKAAGYVKKWDNWVPHELSTKNIMDRVSIANRC